MRILVAPQEFKGSLSAREAAEAIAVGLRRALPDVEFDLLPLADGGPGTVEALVEASGGRFHEADAHGPLGRPVRARWGALGAPGSPRRWALACWTPNAATYSQAARPSPGWLASTPRGSTRAWARWRSSSRPT